MSSRAGFREVGHSVERKGLAKVTGRAQYLDDLTIPGVVYAALVRSPYAHARIVRVEASGALALPGVMSVVTAADLGALGTLYEQMVYGPGGSLLNASMIEYRVPLSTDLPEILNATLVENADGTGPFGAKGMGEGGGLPVAPAVANAVARATGVRIRELPLTPERVWASLHASESGSA